MLACLHLPGDRPFQLLSCSQMNTGPQKWDAPQNMRSAQYPSPAELDAYAKRVADSPLTIKIFPSSVKVPQKKHVRRTVNGLDTSSQRYSPYPSQVGAKPGLLAVVGAPASKGVLNRADGARVHVFPGASVELLTRPCIPQSTLTLPQSVPHLQGPLRPHQLPQQQGLLPPQALGHTRQRATPCVQMAPQHQAPPQDLRPAPGPAHLLSLLHPQGLPPTQTQPHLQAMQLPPHNATLQHTQPNPCGTPKMPDGEAPPNVTMSTSTIPLSMAAGLRHTRPANLTGIVHQISRFCEARAGTGTTSVCEGRIANPSPISRDVFTRVSWRPPACTQGPADSVACGAVPRGTLPPVNVACVSHTPSFHADREAQPQTQFWRQQQTAPLHGVSEAGHPCNPLSLDGSGMPAFASKAVGYPLDLHLGQPLSLRPPKQTTPSPPANGFARGVCYTNGHYFPPSWSSVLPMHSGGASQDLALPFPGGLVPQLGPSVDCPPVVNHRVAPSSSTHPDLMQSGECVGGEFHAPGLQDQNLSLLRKMTRPGPAGGAEASVSRNVHVQHPGYR